MNLPLASNEAGVIRLRVHAGKLSLQGKTLVPDPRKGFLYFLMSDDKLTHLCWKERGPVYMSLGGGRPEDDIVIVKGQGHCERINRSLSSSTTTSNDYLYVFKFETEPKRLFYWIQEIRTDKKETEWLEQVNDLLSNGNNTSKRVGSVGKLDPLKSVSNKNIKINEEAFLKAIPTGIPGIAPLNPDLPKLTQCLASIKVPSQRRLQDLFTADIWQPLLADPKIVSRLVPHLPTLSSSHFSVEILAILKSPPFVQLLQCLDTIINSDEMPSFMHQLGLCPNDAELYGRGVSALLDILRKHTSNKKAP